MSSEEIKYTILESWPMIKEDFQGFIKDPTWWFIDRLEHAAGDRDWEEVNKLIDIFKLVNSTFEPHSH